MYRRSGAATAGVAATATGMAAVTAGVAATATGVAAITAGVGRRGHRRRRGRLPHARRPIAVTVPPRLRTSALFLPHPFAGEHAYHAGSLPGRSCHMVKVALLVRLEAKPGQEQALESFLKSALPLANQELFTPVWFALKLGPSTFGIFDAFTDESGRKAHLTGRLPPP